jgi:metal transporter CNNM
LSCDRYSELLALSLRHPSLIPLRVPMRSNLPTLIFLLRTTLASPYFRDNVPIGDPPAEPGSSQFWSKLLVSVGLVLAGGVFAGFVVVIGFLCIWPDKWLYRLTLGLMGLDELHLRVLATSSEDLKVKKNAQKGTRMASFVEPV